jgi:hypothetical protein
VSGVKFIDRTEGARQAVRLQAGIALAESAMHMEKLVVRELNGHGDPKNKAVDTGHLVGSVNWRTFDGGTTTEDGLEGHTGFGEAAVGTNVEYAPHVEYGTKHMASRPCFRVGAANALGGIRTIFRRRLGEVDVKGADDGV